jgi:hypothetical protein
MALRQNQRRRSASMNQQPLDLAWNYKSLWDNFGEHNAKLERRILGISDRGGVALAAGFAEWIARTLRPHSNDPILVRYIEAVWVGIVDWTYLDPRANPEDRLKWNKAKDLAQSVLYAAAIALGEIVNVAIDEEPVAGFVVTFAGLVERVLPNPRPFREWQRSTIARLLEITPAPEDEDEDSCGEPMPPEVLKPTFLFTRKKADARIDRFLRSVDYMRNPYLRAPRDVLRAGFRGTPYRFRRSG